MVCQVSPFGDPSELIYWNIGGKIDKKEEILEYGGIDIQLTGASTR